MRKIVVEKKNPLLLSAFLKAQFPRLPGWALREALKNKDIRVNGKRVGEDVEVRNGDEITLHIDDARLDGPPLEVALFTENLTVAVKPQGVVSKVEGEADMESLVNAWLREKGETATVRACHRLDTQTGGLMIFARNEQAEKAVRAMMEAGKIEKTYLCVVKGVPSPAHAVLTSWMRKDAEKALVAVFDKPVSGARTAVTEYAVKEQDGEMSLLEVKLHTGRTHQIRAQMAHIGCPILGDDKYGDREFNKKHGAKKQKLWATGLKFDFSSEDCPALNKIAGLVLHSPAPFADEWKARR